MIGLSQTTENGEKGERYHWICWSDGLGDIGDYGRQGRGGVSVFSHGLIHWVRVVSMVAQVVLNRSNGRDRKSRLARSGIRG